jgi:CubicO group peptidase (beta-lactamase class C family)
MSGEGLSRERLGLMHDVMAGYVERGDMPGLVTLVSRRGEVHVDVIGTRAAGGSDLMRRDTIVRIASMTKPIIAAAAMILVEECRLRLDEPVDRLLPELSGRTVLRRLGAQLDDTVPAHRPISVRDLLTFRMGLGLVLAMPGTYPIQEAMDERPPEQKAASAFVPGWFDSHGWGFGMSVLTDTTAWPDLWEPSAGTAASAPRGRRIRARRWSPS